MSLFDTTLTVEYSAYEALEKENKALRKELDREGTTLRELEQQLEELLGRVNPITSDWRHGREVHDFDLNLLSEKQIEIETELKARGDDRRVRGDFDRRVLKKEQGE